MNALLSSHTFQLRSQLIVIAENSTFNDRDLRSYLRQIQQECIEELRKAIEARRATTRGSEELSEEGDVANNDGN